MSDDLVERLQTPRPMSMFLTRADQAKDWAEQMKAAADRIEELEAKLAQQDDLVQAAVAAALREAANIARASFDGEIGYDDILALITPDAQAALDRVVAARFGTVRSEVVQLSIEGKIESEATERLLVAIRKRRE